MEIVVRKRGGRSFKHGSGKLSVSERQALQDKKADLEAQLQDISYSNIQDKENLQEQLKRTKDLLVQDEDKTAKGSERGKLEGRKKELEEYIRLHVPPMKLQQAKPGSPEYDEAVRWGIRASQPDVVQKCEEYKNVCRRLEPTDPNAGDVEILVSKG